MFRVTRLGVLVYPLVACVASCQLGLDPGAGAQLLYPAKLSALCLVLVLVSGLVWLTVLVIDLPCIPPRSTAERLNTFF